MFFCCFRGGEATLDSQAASWWCYLSSYQELEDWVREKVQSWVQELLEEEVTELLGRDKSERRGRVDPASGYRNGYGKKRRLTLSSGTITVRRPRVRDLEERFESRVLPLFAAWTSKYET